LSAVHTRVAFGGRFVDLLSRDNTVVEHERLVERCGAGRRLIGSRVVY
jgi:hypothetical protein